MRPKQRDQLTPEQQQIVVKNMPLVRLIAGKFARNLPPGWEFEDLVQVGAMALGRAAQEYDPAKGFTFGTFAGRITEHALIGVMAAARRMVRDERSVRHVSVHPGDGREVSIRDARCENPAEAAIRNDFLRHGLSKLRPRWRQAVELHFFHDMTHDEVGAAMGVSRARAGWLIQKSLELMRDERKLEKVIRIKFSRPEMPTKRDEDRLEVREPTTRATNSRGVVCIEDDWFYPTVSVAAADIGRSSAALCMAIRGCRPICGKTYRYATPEELDRYWLARKAELAAA